MPQLQTITFNIGDKSPPSKAVECHQQQSSFNSVIGATLGTSLLFNINIGKYGSKKLVAVWKCNNQIIPHRRSFYEYRSTRTTIGFLIVSVKTEDIGSWTAELYDLNTLESRSRLPYEFAVQVSRAPSGRSNDQRKLNATATAPVKEVVNGTTAKTNHRSVKTVIKSSINGDGSRGTPAQLKLKNDVRLSRPKTISSVSKPSVVNSAHAVIVQSRRVSPSSKATGPTQVVGQANQVNIRQCRQESFVRPSLASTSRHHASTVQSNSRKIGANSQEERFVRRNATLAPATINNRSTGYKQNPDCRRPIKVLNAANLNRNQSSKIAFSTAAEKEQQRELATTTKASLYPRLGREPSSAVLVVTRKANAVNNVVNKARQDALSSSDRVKTNGRFVNKTQSSGCVPAVVLATTTTVLETFNTEKQVHLQQSPSVRIDSVPKMQRVEVNKSEVGAKAKPSDSQTSANGGTGIKVKATGSGKISDLINKFNNCPSSRATSTTTTSDGGKPKPDRRTVGRLTIPKFSKDEKLHDGKSTQDFKPKVKLISSPVPPVRSCGDNVPSVKPESSSQSPVSTPAKVIRENHVPETENVLLVPDQAQLNPEEITKEFEPTPLNSDSSVLQFKKLEVDQVLAVEFKSEEKQTSDNHQEIRSTSIVFETIESQNRLQDSPEDPTEEETKDCLAENSIIANEVKDAGNLNESEVSSECMKQPIVDLNGNETSKIVQEPFPTAPKPAAIATAATTGEQIVRGSPKEPSRAANGIQERIHIVAKIGARVELTTLSDADDSAEIAPNQEIQWRLPNKKVTAGERNLVLENVSFAHSGKYEAVISKRRGSVLTKTFSLNVEGPPDSVTRLSVSKLQNPPTVEVSWKGCAFDGGSGILHYVVQYRGEEFQTSDVSIKIPLCDDEEATTSHTFQVAAVNKHGKGPWSTIDYCECIEIEDADKFHDYTKLEELGKGRFGTVSRVEYFGHCYAGKFIKAIRAADREKAKLEVQILSRLRGHERLVNIVAAFQLQREVVILTELLTGGELFERIVADDFHLTEAKCKEFVQEILAGIDYVHSKSIIHLDIKPENILITPTGLKLIDFGLSQIFDPNQKQCVLFGTPEFVSPEIINYEPIGFYCDIWSIGVVTYVLVSGLSPFMGDADSETFANVTLGEFDFDDEAFEQVSQECLDFIRACLTRSPVNRPSTQECINHPWMLQNSDATIRKDKLKSFVLRRKWQKTGNAIRAIGRLRSYGSFNNDALNST